jgi:ACT domain-containing protein
MKKHNSSKLFLEEVAKVPIVQIACEKVGISRNTVYRWRKEDSEFASKMDTALAEGVEYINDVAESQLLNMVKEKNFPALSLWLRHRHSAYKAKLEVTTKEDNDELSPEQAEIVQKALSMSGLTKADHE